MQTQNTVKNNLDLFSVSNPMVNLSSMKSLNMIYSMLYQLNNTLVCLNLLDKYCLWALPDQPLQKNGDSDIHCIEKYTAASSICDYDTNQRIIPRTRKSNLPNIKNKLQRILQRKNEGKLTPFKQCIKRIRGGLGNKSGRRSRYVGVSKNNQHWQVLINVGNSKKYIGTYATQKQAAIAYDFYCIAIHSTKAKVNFTYSIELIELMINSYFENDEHFDPIEFESLV